MDEPKRTGERRLHRPYPAELRERAVRMVQEHRAEYPSRMAAIRSIAAKMGVHWTTLHTWTKQDEVDGGKRAGLTSGEQEELRELRRENRELRRANEILKSASAFFARELDPQPPKR